ncbi:MAG: hypothetical protein RBT36_01645 [Desulfobulbus sp.]|jgi:hypothetical protein|nr:hypothetical protein [Desulfobulbus sp.]
MQDIESFLTLEVKKEIADRYFGSRKLIEDDSKEYDRQVQEAFRHLENSVGLDLVRLYQLLGSEPLVYDFFRLTGLRDETFFDPYLLRSPTIRRRLFAGHRCHGLTRRTRFQNLVLDIYSQLLEGAEAHRAILGKLAAEQETIVEEINQFYRKNDLSEMMGFLRGLDGAGAEGPLAGAVTSWQDSDLAERMRLQAPAAAEQLLPHLPELPSLKACRSKLLDLADTAYQQQGQPDVRDLVRGG